MNGSPALPTCLAAPAGAGWSADDPRCIGAAEARLGTETRRLRDGRSVRVRPVRPDDAAAEQRFVAALSPRARLLRFHGAVNLLPPALLRRFTEVDQRQHAALVAETRTDDGLVLLVADARYVVDAGDPGRAEFAVVVADDWQRLGLARALLQRLARHAARNGVQHLGGSVLPGNEPMLALMRTLGAQLRSAGGLTEARFLLPA